MISLAAPSSTVFASVAHVASTAFLVPDAPAEIWRNCLQYGMPSPPGFDDLMGNDFFASRVMRMNFLPVPGFAHRQIPG